MSNLAVVVIIAHKDNLTENEKLSLLRCHEVFSKYSIQLICPKGLDVAVYRQVIPAVQIEFIDPHWQSSYRMFSLLKVDELLYKKYKKYDFLLFYELDAWVFKDELEYWCSMKFDYIGAPWFEGWHGEGSDSITGVGNGGFSLRNIKSSIRLIKRIRFLKLLRAFWFKSGLQSVIAFDTITLFFKSVFKIDNPKLLTRLLLEKEIYEDVFWCERIGKVFHDFTIADPNNAMKFSFEVKPSLLYQKNEKRLPFGCHAWEKYEPEFWKEFIQSN